MTFATTYSYSDRRIFDLKTLVEAIKFIIINSILALIFVFLTFEEFEWAIFSHRENITDKVIDQTSWNINTLILQKLWGGVDALKRSQNPDRKY